MTRLSATGSHRPPPRHSRQGSKGRWLLWMPALMVGALFYWVVALGMGSLSLVAVSAISGAGGAPSEPAEAAVTDPAEDTAEPGVTDEAIVVRLQDEGDESADVDEADAVVDGEGALGEGQRPSLEPTAVEPMSGI